MTDRPGHPVVPSVAIQCNLLAVPPLQKLPRQEDPMHETITEAIAGDQEENDAAADLDTSFNITQEDNTTQ